MLGDEQVFQHRHARKQADILEGARDARVPGDAKSLHALQQKPAPFVVKGDASDAGPVEAGDAIEDRGLSGTVGADDSGDLTPPSGKRNVVDGGNALEAHRKMADLKHRMCRHIRGR